MRSGVPAGHDGFFHETAFYASDEEFLAVVLPFLQDGLAAGEPTVSVFSGYNQQLVSAALGRGSGVVFIDGDHHYLRPAAAIRRHREMLAGYVDQGAVQVRVAGDVPHPGVGVPWEWWARYEAAANEVYNDYPMYGLCPYDTRTAPPHVLDHVRRTHTHVATATGDRLPSAAYQNPYDFLATAVSPWIEPIEESRPVIELADPLPARARDLVATLQVLAGLTVEDVNGLVVSVSEAVTNALVHGRPPVLLRAWAEPGRIVVTVTDHGPGPGSPTSGLLPRSGPGGLGLWMAHQLCAYVSLQREPDSFTIRLIAGAPSS